MPVFNLLDSLRGRMNKKAAKKSVQRRQSHQTRRNRRAMFQSLEDRRVLASFVVVTGGDAGTGSCTVGSCTLRDAISAANVAAGPDIITFDSSVTGTILLEAVGGELTITDPLTITGPGSDVLTIRANANASNEFRVFGASTTAGDVALEGLNITGGRVSLDAGGGIQFESSGTLAIRSSVISGNVANNGGGIYSRYDGTVEVTSSTIASNTALYGFGGGIQNVDGSTSVLSSLVDDNRAYYSGGGIFSQYLGSVTITDSQITNNKVTEPGQHGGGLYSGEGSVTISGSTISGNTAESDGGGLYNYNGDFSITNSSILSNEADESGGGLFNYAGSIAITNTIISDNESRYGDGGGVSNAAGNLTLTRSTITGNRAVTDGGGIANSSGRIVSRDSTISSNTTGADGGGIATLSGDITLINSTVSGNQANVRGGGIKSDSAFVRLVNSTVTLNTASIEGGGVHLNDNDSGEGILIYNSIIAQNTSALAADFSAPFDPANDLDVQFSLIGNNDGTTLAAAATADANGNFIGTSAVPINAMLELLASNGGPTNTHSLNFGSVAVDGGSDSLAIDFGADGVAGGGDDTALTSDQRGGLFARIAMQTSNTVDMGATELQLTPQLEVDTLEDADDGDLSVGDRSLREMIRLANDNAGADTILVSGALSGSIVLDPTLGPIAITDTVDIIGPNAITLLTIEKGDGQDSRLFTISGATTDVKFDAFQFVGGAAGTGDGGAILSSGRDLTISRSSFTGNSAASGGAIALTAGTLALAASTLSGNSATASGGAVAASGTATAIDVVVSTLSGNTATLSGGGVFSENAVVAVTNSTVTLNSAGTSGGGVGLLADGNGEALDIDNSIIAGNTGVTAPDFLAPFSAGDLDVAASLIGDSAGTTLTPDGILIGGGAQAVIDPQLSALSDNGGPTETHSPITGSPAIGAGDNSLLPSDTFDINGNNNRTEVLPADQRGANRVVDTLDIGAVEIATPAVVTWADPADIVFGTTLDATQLNATATSIGTFSYTPDFGTVLSAGDAQVLTAVFTPNNPLLVGATTTTVTINVSKANPVITWDDPSAIDFNTPLSATQLNATADIAGTFVYDPAIDAILDAGTQTLSTTFTPDESGNFNEVTVTSTIIVNAIDPVVTWSDPTGITFGELLSSTQLNATASTSGTFVYSPDIDAQLNAGDDQVLTVTFTPDSGNFNEIAATVMIDVAKADPVLTWNDPSDIGGGTPLSDTQLNATADTPGTFVYTPNAGTVLSGGDNQTLAVAFTPTDAANYNAANATVTINVVVGEDFGDAPSPYPTLLADDGARHTASSLTLGSGIDAEGDGQPSAAADGDGADEDGVSVIATPIASASDSTTASLLVNVSGASQLDAWIDFNSDGDWNDVGEQIATNLSLSTGDNTLSYTVPAGAVVGTTFARFRLSSTGGLSPTGAASDGEVEDHSITLLGGAATSTVALPSTSASITLDATSFSVAEGSTNLFVAPADGLGAVDVQGGGSDDSITLDFDGGPSSGLSVDGLAGSNTLVVNGPAIDLTSVGLVSAANFQSIDLTDTGESSVTLDAASVAALSPSDKTVTVLGAARDEIVFADATDWRLGEPTINGSDFFQVATNQLSGEIVRFNLPAGWQNAIDASDVNNNGEVTAGDALVIINELGRRLFSDGGTQALDDPLTTTPWPGTYYDQNGDLSVTALDALRVINRLAQITNGGELVEGELVPGEDAISQVVRALQSLQFGTDSSVADDGDAADISLTTKVQSFAESAGPSVANSVDEALSGSDTTEEDWAVAVDELLSEIE